MTLRASRPFPLSLLLASLLILSVLLHVDYPAHVLSWRWLLPSADVWALLVLLALAACGGKRWLAWTLPPLWLLYLVLRLFRVGETVVPMYLNRPFNLYLDSAYLHDLYDLLRTSSHHQDFLVLAAGIMLAALGLCGASWLAWRWAARALAHLRLRSAFLAFSGLLLGIALVGPWPPSGSLTLVRLAEAIEGIRRQNQQQQAFVARLDQVARQRQADQAALTGLAGADVLLFIVESYGHAALNQPRYRPAMEATLARFGQTLARQGLTAVSSYLQSPTFGGSSWLAHATLESGVRVGNDLEQAALLRSSVQPMAALFRRSGYRTLSVMPGTRFAFPQGAYFGYEQVYYAWHFDYQGPAFGWAPMPDQFVLDRVRRRELLQRRHPVFVRYALVSSHASFRTQPPYIADWDRIGDGSLYHREPPVVFPVEWPHLENAGEAYLRSLDYEFTILGDYLTRFVTADTLIIILGDHQPPVQLTGPDAPWSVPVHVISRASRLLAPFRNRGYTSGLLPAQPLPHAGMETFLPGLLQDFR